MGAPRNPSEQLLDGHLKEAERLRKDFAAQLAARGGLMDAYTGLLTKLREINIYDPRKGEANPKEFIKLAGLSTMEARQAIAFRGPSDGVARSLMKHLPALGLTKEENLIAALLCILEDQEQCIANLAYAKLPAEDQELVLLAALMNHPILSFEDFKTQEVMYQTATSEDQREMLEIQRRFDQARSKKTQHIRRHAINYIPPEIRQRMDDRKMLIKAGLERDAFGTLEALKEAISQENLKSTTTNLLDGLSAEENLELLEAIAGMGMGLASSYLDIFEIPDDPEYYPRLCEIFKNDIIAGQSLFGAYALEGAHHYPFGLEYIEIVLPRRVSSAEALDYLRRGEIDPTAPPRAYTRAEIAEAATMLRERDVRRFLENLRDEIARHWNLFVPDQKKNVVFGDLALKVRDVLFLLAHSFFEDEEKFENIISMIHKTHPIYSNSPGKVNTLANRYYFLDLIGFNVESLFTRTRQPSGSFGSLIEELSDYQARNFLHLGMSIYLRVGDILFKDLPIAWNMLIGQCDGKIDAAFNDLIQLFDSFDSLLTIIAPIIKDLPTWLDAALIGALLQDSPGLPMSAKAPKAAAQGQLRITTRAMVAKTMDALNRYCMDALQIRAKQEGTAPINIIQQLKLPRGKMDKLMVLLHKDPKKGKK
jgi:hypothetical protein